MALPVDPFTDVVSLEKRWLQDGHLTCLKDPLQSVQLDLEWGVVVDRSFFLLTDYGISDPYKTFSVMFGIFGGVRMFDSKTMEDFVSALPRNVWLALYREPNGFVIKDVLDVAVCSITDTSG